MRITAQVDPTSLRDTVVALNNYWLDLRQRANTICERLASIGAVSASLGFSRAFYTGRNDVDITVEPYGNGFAVLASGQTVLFLEFGAGITMGYGHPQAAEFGFGAGTYPGRGHWDDPNGWWTPAGEHTFGNPPTLAMYNASREIREEVTRVCREVLSA